MGTQHGAPVVWSGENQYTSVCCSRCRWRDALHEMRTFKLRGRILKCTQTAEERKTREAELEKRVREQRKANGGKHRAHDWKIAPGVAFRRRCPFFTHVRPAQRNSPFVQLNCANGNSSCDGLNP